MSIVECGNGHIYDADQYAACPYCNGNQTSINFEKPSGDHASGEGRTVAPAWNGDVKREYPSAQPAQSSVSEKNGGYREPGKTVAPAAYRKKMDRENRTVGVFKKRYNLDPVVGWLVCIKGSEKGKGYHLWAKINTIGRSESMDVCIGGDMTISKENHARLAYDPKHNNFRLLPGESMNTIYLNDEPIYVPTLINAYDCVELGESKFLFVPFCCDKFRWEDLSKKEEA